MATDASPAIFRPATQPARPLVVGLGPVPAEEVVPILGSGIRFEPNPDDADLRQASGAIMRASETVDVAALDAMPQLQIIVRTGVGYENVDVRAAADRNVLVCITPGSNTHAVAEGTVAHLLHLVKSLGQFTALIRDGGWDERTEIPIGDLEGATLGILGYGRIGQRVAHLAQAFGMRVLAHDEIADVPESIRASQFELLHRADVVTLHLPLLESTKHIIDSEAISSMKRGAILLNMSRGGLIDEDAALEGLETGQLSGVGLDAFDPEPPRPHDLYLHPRTVLTPHVLGLSRNAAHRSYVMAAQIVRDLFDGKEPATAVSPD
jgi:D-3-phosphoglycerate dehydrogenase